MDIIKKILKMTFALILATIYVCLAIILMIAIELAVIVNFAAGCHFANFLVYILIGMVIISLAKDIYDDLE